VWTPGIQSAGIQSSSIEAGQAERQLKRAVPSELIFETSSSHGHFHIFAYTWWSYLNIVGLEYDRHSWGRFVGARMDYVAEILPVVILRQPSKTDVFGDPLTNEREPNPGLGISPIGLRMIWRDGKYWKPYYLIKAGMVGFAHKSLSGYASYENFTLQQSIGLQFRLSQRWDLRCGLSDIHFSNAFVVPNNPGIDEMAYSAGVSYHLRSGPGGF
jgi:hypothetical protein